MTWWTVVMRSWWWLVTVIMSFHPCVVQSSRRWQCCMSYTRRHATASSTHVTAAMLTSTRDITAPSVMWVLVYQSVYVLCISVGICLFGLWEMVQLIAGMSCASPLHLMTCRYCVICDSKYVIARIWYRNSVCLSVCLSVRRWNHRKTVEVRIMKFSP